MRPVFLLLFFNQAFKKAMARGMLRGEPSPGSFIDIEKARRWRRQADAR